MSVYKPLMWFLNNECGVNESGEPVFMSPRTTFLFGDFDRRTASEVATGLRAARRRNLRIDFRLYVVPALILQGGAVLCVYVVPWMFGDF
ncbi:hypothetical protein SAMN04489740_0882 [Arthrobacter alpinus]|uniref:Uncharacterized protein n=1 Tax=Arthrobacter alpinus TaxID=656366 RepID=A0A1H5GZ35_9MICC|nr:hypothetical protein SAMN04489740_0882 [Arthrobacter alpinus]